MEIKQIILSTTLQTKAFKACYEHMLLLWLLGFQIYRQLLCWTIGYQFQFLLSPNYIICIRSPLLCSCESCLPEVLMRCPIRSWVILFCRCLPLLPDHDLVCFGSSCMARPTSGLVFSSVGFRSLFHHHSGFRVSPLLTFPSQVLVPAACWQGSRRCDLRCVLQFQVRCQLPNCILGWALDTGFVFRGALPNPLLLFDMHCQKWPGNGIHILFSTSGRATTTTTTTTTTQNDIWCNIYFPLVLSRFCIVKWKRGFRCSIWWSTRWGSQLSWSRLGRSLTICLLRLCFGVRCKLRVGVGIRGCALAFSRANASKQLEISHAPEFGFFVCLEHCLGKLRYDSMLSVW